MNPDEPRRIGPYEVRDTIGRGGMAAVYKAYQASLDRVVAIKVISAHLASEPEFMERFRQEARAVARLSHPNVVIVHDFGEDGGLPYLVMEHVDGVTLADMLDEGIPQGQTVDLLAQVASGLDYAHSRGIVHRDIKPQNVLVTHEGRAVLADFGLARIMESARRLTMSGGVVGTPEYMSPEQASGRPTDHRTDVYALGVILYEMVAGLRPFSAETPLGVLMKHLQEPPPPVHEFRPDLPPSVDAVIQKALAKQPEERFQSASELARAFRDALSGQTEIAAAVGPRSAAPGIADVARAPAPVSGVGFTPPELDLSRYPGLKAKGVRLVRPHQTPSMARAAPPPAALPPPPQEPAPPAPKTRICPECQATLPPGASMCSECTYLLPFEEVASRPVRREPERREERVNLLPYNLRWDPTGLERARQLAQNAVDRLAGQGWELVIPLDAAGTFVQGRSVSGPIVQSAVLKLKRTT
jgi:serine/threonine-protein kinase